jgi:dienelactone hydrolase
MTFNLSPSLYHERLMRNLTPSMTWRGGDVAAWQQELRAQLMTQLGLDLDAIAREPLNVRSLWKRDHPLGTIEKIVFTSEPEVDVPAYVCLPANAQPPYTFFICLQGHSTGMHNSIGVAIDDETTPIVTDGDRDFGIGCMQRGIAALCIEQRSFGERREKRRGLNDALCHEAAMNALLLGRTLVGERIVDVDRGIDYLAARGDCAMDRLGVMGNSGGGTVSLFAGAVLPRLRFVMPSCYFCSFAASIQAMFHCSCNYIPGLMQYAEMGDIAGLIAPTPLVLVSGDEDGIFPIEAARAEFRRVQEIYAAAGAPDAVRHVVCHGDHRFYADEAWGAYFEMTAGRPTA